MKRIVVLGGGESGVGSAVLAKVKGFDVFLSDSGKIAGKYVEMLEKWGIPYEQGGHTEELVLNADEVIKSPGIPSAAPMVEKISRAGIGIISEIEFAGRYDKAKKICITGSNGKTTTTSLIYYLLQNAGLNVGLGGNIGKSYALQVATENFDIYVLELSSFQLDNMYDFKADIAIITNITPDHLDRYDHNLENYVRAKFRITRNMNSDDCFIFCSDDEITINHLNKIIVKAKQLPFTQKGEVSEGAFVKDDKMIVRYRDSEYDMYIQELALGGKHNVAVEIGTDGREGHRILLRDRLIYGIGVAVTVYLIRLGCPTAAWLNQVGVVIHPYLYGVGLGYRGFTSIQIRGLRIPTRIRAVTV